MALSWKTLDYFYSQSVPVPSAETQHLLSSNQITSLATDADSLVLGSYDGHVRVLGNPSTWAVASSFAAYESTQAITHLWLVPGTSYLVTIGEDLSSKPELKLWALDRIPAAKNNNRTNTNNNNNNSNNNNNNKPACLSTVRIQNGQKTQFPVSALCVMDDLCQLAVGFANGSVTVVRGDLIHDMGAKQRVVYESEEPITGLQLSVSTSTPETNMLIATTARLVKLSLSRKGQTSPPKTWEDSGCAVGCMTTDPATGDIHVARPDALYYYTMERGRGAPRAYEAPKSSITLFRDYAVLVCPPSADSQATASLQTRFQGHGNAAAESLWTASSLVILEADLRIVAYSQPLLSPIQHVFRVWGGLYLLTRDGKILRIVEKSLRQRLDILFQRNMYPLALDLAHKAQLEAAQISTIHAKFAHHLYQRGDLDGAMTQYLRALDVVEPSQVIRQYLDSQQIHNLIQYLEQLHHHEKATPDHTMLLLNCYAKLKDTAKLEAFIRQSAADAKFDVETAIRMCRQGGYYRQAVYLAEKHGDVEMVVDVLLQDSHQYEEALAFLWQQEPALTYSCLVQYARTLLSHCPDATTVLLVEYYTGCYQPRSAEEFHTTTESTKNLASTTTTDTPTKPGLGESTLVESTLATMQNITSYLPLPHASKADAEQSPAAHADETAESTVRVTLPTEPSTTPTDTYTRPSPRTAFSFFLSQPQQLIVFLEACLASRAVTEAERADVCTTLLELYLYQSRHAPTTADWQAKAKALIDVTPDTKDVVPVGQALQDDSGADRSSETESGKMESEAVLLLSHLAQFREGTIAVQEQAGLLFDIFRSYTAVRDTAGAMRALHQYGPQEPQLYPAALAYLTSDPRVWEEAGPEAWQHVLDKIDEGGLMAPLQVIQTLVSQSEQYGELADRTERLGVSEGPDEKLDGHRHPTDQPSDVRGGTAKNREVATMGMVQAYLRRTLERERQEVATQRRRIQAFRTETAQKQEEYTQLATTPTVFQATRCAECGGSLDLPIVHFLCRHSFHQRCLRTRTLDPLPEQGTVANHDQGDGRHRFDDTDAGGRHGGRDDVECPLCAKDHATIRALRQSQAETATKHDLFKDELARSTQHRFSTIADWFGRGVMSW